MEEWLLLLEGMGIPCAPIQDLGQLFRDSRVVHRDMVTEVAQGETMIPLLNPAMKIPTAPATVRLPPPQLGEHSREILEELYGADGYLELSDEGVV